MRRLYLRLYLAALASLAAFALAAGVLWRQFGEPGPASHVSDVVGTLPQNVLPPAGAEAPAQQVPLLERLDANLRADVALFVRTTCGSPRSAPRCRRRRRAGAADDGGIDRHGGR